MDELKNNSDTYAESFLFVESELTEALQDHERLTEIDDNFNRVKELVQKQMAEDAEQERNADSNECDANGVPSSCNLSEADDAMKYFIDIGEKHEAAYVTGIVSELNTGQKRVFDKVTEIIRSQ